MAALMGIRDVTVGDLLTRRREPAGIHALLYEAGPRYTFRELEREARTIARGLMACGVAPGERVVLWATNVPEWVVLQFALAKIGAILVTANTALRAKRHRLSAPAERGGHRHHDSRLPGRGLRRRA